MEPIPNSIYWFFTPDTIRNKKYLRDIDYIHDNTDIDQMCVTMQAGVIREDYEQCHGVMAELVEYAHKRGIKICLSLSASKGFFNPGFDPNISPEQGQLELHTVDNIYETAALVQETELTADENGFAAYIFEAGGARNKIRPLYNRLLRVYAFRRTTEGFYDPDSLRDITDCVVTLQSRTHGREIEIHGGRECAGMTFYAMLAQYYNWYDLFGEADWRYKKSIMDLYADIPLDGVLMDENGFLLLNTSDVNSGANPPFRHRLYSSGHKAYYRQTLGLELDEELFHMRYAPEGNPGVRIRAINRYFDSLRVPVVEIENRVAAYSKQLFGDGAYLGVHNTFHNNLEEDEVWHTACAWWDLPRRFGHTDEFLPFPIRMGILLSGTDPRMIHMYYSKAPEDTYREMLYDAPFNIRIFHHALDDFYWGSSYRDPEMVKTIRRLDREIGKLNDFQTQPPKMDLLIVYGSTAQNNWYPDEGARNRWDINGSLKLFQKCDAIWEAGYRAAMVPDYSILDGRVRFENGRVSYNGYTFTHLLFLYPRYAKAEVYTFLEEVYASGFPMLVIGDADMDFEAEKMTPIFPTCPEFDVKQLQTIGCPRSAIPEGCVYKDGSFCLVGQGLLSGEETQFDFVLDGRHYSGTSTGLLAYRGDRIFTRSPGTRLYCDGREITE